jgi:CRP-like cAMP-binding protein
MTPAEAHRIVRATGWLARQPAPIQALLLDRSELLRFQPSMTLYDLEAEPGGIIGLASGVVGASIAPHPFPARLAFIAGEGWWVGEGAAVTETPRRAELVARTQVWALYIPPAKLKSAAEIEPRLWHCLATLTVQHVDDALMGYACLAVQDPTARLAGTIRRLFSALPAQKGPTLFPVNQAELAELACLSRNTVGRSLAVLERDGSLSRQYGRLLVDLNRLNEWLQRHFSS